MFKFKNKLLKGALILSIGGFITKVIGAIYRIPLTNILGAEGIGLYQMVFPLYSLLLTISSTGVPNGISKLIAEGKNANAVLKSALCFFVPISFVASLLMALFSYQIASVQGNILAKNCYISIAPSVLAVSVICCFRGYFQGGCDMKPTAISQILEQIVKLSVGLSLCYFVRGGVVRLATFATIAVTVSEIVTCVYFIILKKVKGGGFSALFSQKCQIPMVLKTVIPIMLCTLILPTTRTIESFYIVNILNKYTESATSLFGLYSGAVESIVGVPIALCYGVAVTAVPEIASKKNKGQNYKSKIVEAIVLTAFSSLIFAIIFFFGAKLVVSVLYKNFSVNETLTTVNLLKLSALSVLLLPIMQTTASILISLGRCNLSIVSCLIATIIKIPLSIILLNIPSINIFGVIISDIVCYLVACFINLVYIISSEARLKKLQT